MKSDRVYLEHMLQMIGRLELAVSIGKPAFMASVIHQDAALRNLHTLTETSQRVTPALRADHPEIDWARLAAFRNVLVHDYLGIDLERIWAVVQQDVPALKESLSRLLASSS